MSLFRKLVAAAGLSLMAGSAMAADVTLRFSTFHPQGHWYVVDHLLPLFKRIEEATEGRVKVQLLPKVVGTAQTQYDVVRDGLADMAYIIPGYTPGRFPLQELGELPLLGDDVRTLAPAFVKLYREEFEKFGEFGEVHPLIIYNVVPVRIFNAKRSLNTVDDFAGLKLRSPGQVTTDLLEAMKAVPILKSTAEVYEMLSTGAIDGQISVAPVLLAGNTASFTNVVTSVPGGFANSVHLIGINKARWESLSEADRKIITETLVPEFNTTLTADWKRQDEEAMKAYATMGYKVETTPPEFVEKFRAIIQPIEDAWIARAKSAGVADPAALLARLRAEAAAAR